MHSIEKGSATMMFSLHVIICLFVSSVFVSSGGVAQVPHGGLTPEAALDFH